MKQIPGICWISQTQHEPDPNLNSAAPQAFWTGAVCITVGNLPACVGPLEPVCPHRQQEVGWIRYPSPPFSELGRRRESGQDHRWGKDVLRHTQSQGAGSCLPCRSQGEKPAFLMPGGTLWPKAGRNSLGRF